MERKHAPRDAAGRNDRPWEDKDSLEQEPVAGADDSVSEADPDAETGEIGELDLDEIDASIDPDFLGAEAWELDPLALDDEEEDGDEADEDEDEEDEAEMRLLHELGIDLDAPDGEESDVDLALDIDQDDPADDGVAA